MQAHKVGSGSLSAGVIVDREALGGGLRYTHRWHEHIGGFAEGRAMYDFADKDWAAQAMLGVRGWW